MKRRLGTSDVQITPLPWGLGKLEKRWVGIEMSTKAIRAALRLVSLQLTPAEVYGEGHSEQIVAQALGDVRDKAVYATKVFASHLK